ncbi:unnamed protein product [Chondrus crispus]|uniref:Uncharacterized protein n=1 Tax=Chondrus crispus TaxID=2769 RepID=R7QRV3_CHOCR|nr:unnamed protein product [Chondrus crispus]CDF41227.1 unnamed protein product [Chondrus crispus]|eukprot:XP_005711521.1 unnamed protein product [Chondrus crispus]
MYVTVFRSFEQAMTSMCLSPAANSGWNDDPWHWQIPIHSLVQQVHA